MSAAGVGDVGDVKSAVRAAGKVPGQKRIDVAENYFAGLGLLSDARHMIEQPADFQAAEIGAERQAGLGAKAVGTAFAGKFGNVVIDAGVLPDQRVGHGLAGFAVPQDGRLTLVGDADGRQIGGAKLPLLQSLRDHVLRGPARSPRDRAPPIPAADRSVRVLFAPPRRSCRRRRTRRSACWWFPDR